MGRTLYFWSDEHSSLAALDYLELMGLSDALLHNIGLHLLVILVNQPKCLSSCLQNSEKMYFVY